MKTTFQILLLCIFVCRLTFSQTATPPSAGDGTEENPYRIATLENLYWIAADSTNWDKHFIQTADIDAGETAEWFGGEGWEPIGNEAIEFTGIYNGNSFFIDSLFISRPTTSYQGLFGLIDGSTISNLAVKNTNISGQYDVGGLVGANKGTITNCYSTGSVSGNAVVGGLVGYGGSSIINCYSTSSVNGYAYIGGLAGNNDNTIINCYSTGSVNGTDQVGGLVGYNFNKVTNSFWDIESSGIESSSGGTGLTTVKMKTASTFSEAGWDNSKWYMDSTFNDGYPYLYWQNPDGTPLPASKTITPSGQGTQEDPYQIATLKNLRWISENDSVWDKHFIQTNDINASITVEWNNGEGWKPIGTYTNKFCGSYNGRGFKIDSLFCNRDSLLSVGLFGSTTNAAIDSLGMTNIDIIGGEFVGGIVGLGIDLTKITNCYSSGKINGQTNIGGLIGISDSSYISNSYSIADLNGNFVVGGLIGTFTYHSIVENCYSRGNVKGDNTVGGFIGFGLNSTISNCYSTGKVTPDGENIGGLFAYSMEPASIVVKSFWDKESSTIDSSAGGTGLTTSEMKNPQTFIEAGWADSVWHIDANFNDGYPYLAWENPIGSPLPVEENEQLPTVYSLSQNYPNPFNPGTKIKYSIPEAGNVVLKIYNMLGQEVATLVNEEKPIGNYIVNFNASSFSSGVYFYSIRTSDYYNVKKMILLK